MKKLYSIFFTLALPIFLTAQITGDTTVCSGYIYNYNATIVGASSYQWTFPNGWYDVTGQGTSTISATCNVSDGNICVEGFDALNNSVGTLCLTIQFGGGGAAGWDVFPQQTVGCYNSTFSLSIVPNGSGGGSCPVGCGSGILIANLGYAIYDGNWPIGNFIGFADGSSISTNFYTGNNGNLYVYYVDYTNGTSPSQAVRVEGGCGGGTVDNSAQFGIPPFPPIYFTQTPDPVCLGDTVTVVDIYGYQGNYGPYIGITILSQNQSQSQMIAVANNMGGFEYSWTDGWCPYSYQFPINVMTCSPDSLIGDTVVCSGYTYNYNALINYAVTYQWTFPSGWYNLTGQGTSNVSATCNINAGNICVEGFDALNNSVGTLCLTTQFGGGIALGWDVQPQNITTCPGDPYVLNIVPNSSGSGSCPNGCGVGSAVSNISFAVYDDVWPFGNFVGFANGTILPVPAVPGNYTYYIYKIDYTNGTSTAQAVRIEGGCGTATVNNIAQLNIPAPIFPSYYQMPNPVCIGDTVNIMVTGALSGSLAPLMGVTQLSGNSFIVNSMPAHLSFSGLDINACPVSDICYISVCGPTTLPGDTIVCAGYSYNYSASIAGAVTYQWLFPTGWYDITGQGTSNVSATCNVNAGWITVSGLDSLGNIVGVEMLLTQFSGGAGWDATPSAYVGCSTDEFTVSVLPNGTGGGSCPSGCGNGIQHPNIIYGIYTDVWGQPGSYFVAEANSISQINFSNSTYYVYKVDTSNGPNAPQAVLIEGGCGTAVVNYVFSVTLVFIYPIFQQTPDPACIGDTVTVYDQTFTSPPFYWSALNDVTFLYQNHPYGYYVVTGTNPVIELVTGCGGGTYNINLTACAVPSVLFASSDTVFCDKQSINFYDFSSNNPTNWQWTFTGATPSTSTLQNPTGIYYATDGSFDVQLIACNSNGCDTLTLYNFITEYLAPVAPVITGNSGTMISTLALTYAWYSTSNPTLILSTDSFYIPTQIGSYYVVTTDSNGCVATSNVFVITKANYLDAANNLLELYPNPNDGTFEIVLNDDFKNQKSKIKIYNTLGEIVFETEFLPQQISNSALRIATQLDNGIYLMDVIHADEINHHKFVVSK